MKNLQGNKEKVRRISEILKQVESGRMQRDLELFSPSPSDYALAFGFAIREIGNEDRTVTKDIQQTA